MLGCRFAWWWCSPSLLLVPHWRVSCLPRSCPSPSCGLVLLCLTPLPPQLWLPLFWSAAVETAGLLELLRSAVAGLLNTERNYRQTSAFALFLRCSMFTSFSLSIFPLSPAYLIYLRFGLRTFGIDTFFPPQVNIGILRPQRQASKRDVFVCLVGGCPP